MSKEGFSSTILTIAVSVAIGAAVTYYITDTTKRQLLDMLYARPRVAVVDFGQLAEVAKVGEKEKLEHAYSRLRQQVEALQAEGVIVINAASIAGAPEEVMVRLPDMLVRGQQ